MLPRAAATHGHARQGCRSRRDKKAMGCSSDQLLMPTPSSEGTIRNPSRPRIALLHRLDY